MAMAASCNFLPLPFSPNHHRPFSTWTSPRPFNLHPPPSLRSSPSSTSVVVHATGGSPFRNSTDPPSGDYDYSTEMVVNPALRNSSVLFCRPGYNVQIVVGEDEPEEVLLRRFRREVSKAGVIPECRRRRFFENKQEEKKRKAREAAKRNRRRRFGSRFSPSSSSPADRDAALKKVRDDADDNWEMPKGDLP